MPTYHAARLTATLRTAPLHETLSPTIELKMGVAQARDADRIAEVFQHQGTNLQERPIGADGSEKGVVQFIGDHEDLPLFMVEAGARIRTATGLVPSPRELTMSSSGRSPSDSSLTAPSQRLTRTSNLDSSPTIQTRSDSPVTHTKLISPQLFPDFEQAQTCLNQQPQTQALMLVIDTTLNPWLTDQEGKKGSLNPKIEIFLNGELVDVTWANPRRTGGQIGWDHKARFSGLRVHRQAEKPWIYRNAATLEPGKFTAQQRWDAIAGALQEEASLRGTNKYDMRPPTGDYLMALSAVPLPDRLREKSSLGVIDVIVTTGYGKKYGPETGYITGPSRMLSTKFMVKKKPQPSPLQDHVVVQNPIACDDIFSPTEPQPAPSPNVPLAKRTRSSHATRSLQPLLTPAKLPFPQSQIQAGNSESVAVSSRNSTADPTSGVNDISEKRSMTPESVKTMHGRQLRSKRSQRPSQVLKMTPKTNEVAKEQSLLEPKTGQGSADPGRKRSRTVSLIETPQTASAEPRGSLARTPATKPRSKKQGTARPRVPMSTTQTRIETALDFGASPDGHLIRKLNSTSPAVQTPDGKFTIESSVNTPQNSPVLDRKGSTTSKATPRHAKGKASNAELDEAFDTFEIPELCRASVVSYAGSPETKRQLAKARAGEFIEMGFVVGMRFVVV